MSPELPLAAVVQMTSTQDVARNLDTAERLVRAAAARGARLIVLPEHFAFLQPEGRPYPEPQQLDGPWVARMAGLARELAVTVLLGSLGERVPGADAIYNTSVLLGPDGATLATYRKIHLFDPALEGLEHLQESRSTRPGSEVVVAATTLGALGLSICYDLRFPELYRALSDRGAQLLAVPAAFTAATGKDHWEPLLRARAIENLSYVLAAGQVGDHGPARSSHGHSMVVDPWGAVIARVADGEGVALAPIDLQRLLTLRQKLPCLRHRRLPLPEVRH